MAEKSYIECDDPNTGDCKINMHFMRMSQTKDNYQDHQIHEDRSTRFKGSIWYNVKDSDGSVVSKGQSDEFEVVTL